jgi:hypothetical protein
MKKIRSENDLCDYDYFRDQVNSNQIIRNFFSSSIDMFNRREEPYVRARLEARIGQVIFYPGALLELIDHASILSSQALGDTANIIIGIGVAGLAIAGATAMTEIVSEEIKLLHPPKDQK